MDLFTEGSKSRQSDLVWHWPEGHAIAVSGYRPMAMPHHQTAGGGEVSRMKYLRLTF